MNNPKVSIIVTSYNNAEFLPKCLNALINQTLADIEIICLDDSSSDDSAKIIQDFAKQDQRIHAVVNPKNLGVSATRNHGITLANAPYIMFCDGDDYFEADACASLYSAIHDHTANLAISEINVIYEAHLEMKPSDNNYYGLKHTGKQLLNDETIYNTDLAPTNKIFKKSLIQEYDIKFPEDKRFEDAYFCVAYMCVAKHAYYLNRRLYNYIRRENSLMSATWSSKSQQDVAIDHLYIAFMLYDFLEQHQLLEKYNDLYWQYFAAFEDFALRNSKSQARIQEVKAAAKQFIQSHTASFNNAKPNDQEAIRRLSSGKFYFSTTRIKRLLIKFLPTYRLATENIQRLKTLGTKHQQLFGQIEKLRQK